MAKTRFSSIFLLSLIAILSITATIISADSDFEGFDADEDFEHDDHSPPPPTTLTTVSDQPPPQDSDQIPTKPSSSFDLWDEYEFEGFEYETPLKETPKTIEKNPENATESEPEKNPKMGPKGISDFCITLLVIFAINYFTGKKENETLALAWVAKFATNDSIFEKNFSLLGVGETEDSQLLLKEGQNVFKFYARGRRFCEGVLGTMELKSRHDLIARLYNMVVPCKDEITFEVYMNDDAAMDCVVFALGKKKLVKGMLKEVRDLQRFGSLMAVPSGRKWVAEELGVVTESKEVAGDLITEAVLDQVFGEKAFEKFGKLFISMHFSDQHPSTHRKMLIFKFALPPADQMADMTRLVALIPYYIDLIGRYKLSSQSNVVGSSSSSRFRVNPIVTKYVQKNARSKVTYNVQSESNENLKFSKLKKEEMHAYRERLSKLQSMLERETYIMSTSKAKEKRIHCYNSSQKILLVGEGNFSFSASLARTLRSANNIVATSYHDENLQAIKHSSSIPHLEELKMLGCLLVFEVDVNKMHSHPVLKEMKFDVIIYNFPHAGHYYIHETSLFLIEMHRKLVGAYFKSASKMLNEGGEVHLRHRDDSPYNKWNVVSLAGESGLKLKDKVMFHMSDYPGYSNVRGGNVRSDDNFPISCAFTFQFTLDFPEIDRDGLKNNEVNDDGLEKKDHDVLVMNGKMLDHHIEALVNQLVKRYYRSRSR